MNSRPNLIVAGAARSGTTALADALGRHPAIGLPRLKEPHFLAHDGLDVDYRGPGDDMVNREVITSVRAYDDLMAEVSGKPVRVDASVSTLAFPERSIRSIQKHLDPNVKVLAVVREPTLRAQSAYLFLRSRGLESVATFAKALELEDQRRANGHHHMWWYQGLSRYRQQVEPFADAFGERFRIIVAEEFQADPASTLRDICTWIGMNHEIDLGPFSEVNRGGQPRSARVARVIQSTRSQPATRAAVRLLTNRRLRERLAQQNLAPSSRLPADETLHRLRVEHADDVLAVERQLGRSVEAWHSLT